MRKSVLALVGVAVVIVIAGFIISRRNNSSPSPGEMVSRTNPGPEARDSTNKGPTLPQHPKPPYRPSEPSPFTNPVIPSPPNQNLITNWEERLDAILTAQDKSDPDKAKELIEMFPNLSPEAQEEIAHHISNLTPDENYAPLGRFLTNST